MEVLNKKLQVRELCKSFDNKKVLDNISFDVYEGEFLSVLGVSGCGKTTLLRILIGLETADSGEIIKGGQDISRPLPEQQIQRLLLRAAARQLRPPVREKSQHMKAHRPPDAGKNGKVPRLPAGNAARALRALDHTLAAAERHMQRVTLITQHGPRLQDPALLHGEQQLLSGIAIRLRMQPFRKHMIHKIPPIPAPIYAGRGRKGDTPWTYRSTISSS